MARLLSTPSKLTLGDGSTLCSHLKEPSLLYLVAGPVQVPAQWLPSKIVTEREVDVVVSVVGG